MNAMIKTQQMTEVAFKAAVYAVIAFSSAYVNAREIVNILNFESTSEMLNCVDDVAFELYENGKINYVQINNEKRRYGI